MIFLYIWLCLLVLLTLAALFFRLYLALLGWSPPADYGSRIESCSKYEHAFFAGGMKELCKVAFSSLFTANCLEIRQAPQETGPTYEYRLKEGVDTPMLDEIERHVAERLSIFKPLPLVIAQISTEEQALNASYTEKMADLGLLYPVGALTRHLEGSSSWLLWLFMVPFLLYLLLAQRDLNPLGLILIGAAMIAISTLPQKILQAPWRSPVPEFPGFFLTGVYSRFMKKYGRQIKSYYGTELSRALEYQPVASCSV